MKYFLHDTNSFDDEKVTELYLNFGYEGLGLFYTILEKIAKQEKPVKTCVLKAQLKVKKRLEKCWSFMEEIGIISSRNGETFNEKLLNYSEMYQIKKEKTRRKVQEWREKQSDTNIVTSYVPVCNPPKVKESKVKESKVKEKEEEIQLEKTPADKPDFIELIIKEFSEAYKNIFGLPYVIISSGKERSSAGKILKIYKETYPDLSSAETLSGLHNYFNAVMLIQDDWLRSNMSLSIIVSKFNEINNKLKHGTTKGFGATGPELAELLAKKFGVTS